MLHLLRLEWLKQRNSIAFRVLMGFYIVLLPTLLLLAKGLPEFPPPINSAEVLFQFPYIFVFMGYLGNWLAFFFLGFLSVTLVTYEFSYRTLRQNIIMGMTRSSYYWSKVLFILAVALFATLYYTLVVFAYGLTHTNPLFDSVIFKNIDYLYRYFLMCLGYMSFGLLLGTLVRRTGIALFLYFSYVAFIELVLRWGVHRRIFPNKSMHFYPMNAIEDLTPFPFSDAFKSMEQELDFPIFLTPVEATITTIAYTLLFLWLTYRLFARRDL